MAADIRSRIGNSRPAFANVFVWNWGAKMGDLKKLLDLLGPEYVAVTPSQLAALTHILDKYRDVSIFVDDLNHATRFLGIRQVQN